MMPDITETLVGCDEELFVSLHGLPEIGVRPSPHFLLENGAAGVSLLA